MLSISPPIPTIATASRRALKAAALTIELSGGRLDDCSIGINGLPPTCLYQARARLCLIPTAADRPLLLGEAEELVQAVQENVVIVRLSTWPNASHLVSFDVLMRRQRTVEIATAWLPCISEEHSQLWLVRRGEDARRLAWIRQGLQACRGSAGLSPADVETGIQRAADFYRRRIWGGF